MMALIAFYLFGILACVAGFMVVISKNPVHSVLWLILTFLCAAGLFVLPFFLFGFKTGHDNRFGILYFQQFFTDLLFLLLVFRERNPPGNKRFIQLPLFFLQFKNLPVKVSLT